MKKIKVKTTDDLFKSGHRAKCTDNHDVNGVSGHISGHDNSIDVDRL